MAKREDGYVTVSVQKPAEDKAEVGMQNCNSLVPHLLADDFPV
jgi:hypothetical protein